MKTAVSVLSALTALDNEPRLMMAMRRLLSDMALQGDRTQAYCDGLALYTYVVNSRYGNEPYPVEDKMTEHDSGEATASLTVTEVSCIQVEPVTFLPPCMGAAVARQVITLVRKTGEPITIHAYREIAGRTAHS